MMAAGHFVKVRTISNDVFSCEPGAERAAALHEVVKQCAAIEAAARSA